jgi:replicative DNA helicase
VAFFSLEMTGEELAHRLLASRAEVSLHEFRSGRLTIDQVNALAAQATETGQRQLLLDDRPAVGLGYLRARCRRWKRKHGLALVIVDYLQLMRGEGDTREQEVSSLSRGLKVLAKELHVPVIALCQLNRALEGRTDKRPQLYDLRESGAIEQDADIVLMLYREDIHGEDTPNRGLAQVLVRKHRNGPLGEVTLRYLAPYCRFESTEERFQASVASVRAATGFRQLSGGELKAAS